MAKKKGELVKSRRSAGRRSAASPWKAPLLLLLALLLFLFLPPATGRDARATEARGEAGRKT